MSRAVPLSKVASALVVALLVGGCTLLVYAGGGTSRAFPHTLYAPIALAAYFFGLPGSVLTALAAGLAVGPLMPLDTASGQVQAASNWLTRLGFYLLTGTIFGTTSGLLLARRRRLEEVVATLEVTNAATLKAFSAIMDTYDDDTGTHCDRVAVNARTLGEELGLCGEELDRLYWAGVLHDVGKVTVPQRVLHKPGSLSDDEYEIVKRHPGYGADLLRSISLVFEPVAVGVESHHERWDGRGYPRGLAGEEIPLFGRILAVVDAFEAMTANRPYRAALPVGEALAELHRQAGRQFDPELVRRYARLCGEGRIYTGVEAVDPSLQRDDSLGPILAGGYSPTT